MKREANKDQNERTCAYVLGDLSPEERRQFEKEIAGSEELRREVRALRRTWEFLGRHSVPEVSFERGFEDLTRRMNISSIPRRFSFKSLRISRAAAVAAAVVAMLVSLTYVYHSQSSRQEFSGPGAGKNPNPILATGRGNQTTLVRGHLRSSDGSFSPEVTLAVDGSVEPGVETARVSPLEGNELLRFHEYTTHVLEYQGDWVDSAAPSATLATWHEPY